MNWRVLLVGALITLASGCAPPTTLLPTPTPPETGAPSPVLHIACPENLAPTLMTLASAYQQEQNAAQVYVIQRADSLALQAVRNGDADIAAVTWLPPAQAGDFWATPFARDGLAIVVHTQNGLPGLTLEQLQQLYLGRVTNWDLWGGLPGTPQLISREEASGDFSFFQAQVMRDQRVSLTAMLAPTSAAVLQFVSADTLAVGYISTAQLQEPARALAIAGAPPSQEALAAGLYPLTRELYLVTRAEPQGALREFAQWVLGPTGQNILLTQRYVPIP